MRLPGFLSELQAQLESLPLEELTRMNKPGGLEVVDLINLTLNPRDFTVDHPLHIEENQVLKSSSIPIDTFFEGMNAYNRKEAAFCLVATQDSYNLFPGKNYTVLAHCLMKCLYSSDIWILAHPEKVQETNFIARSINSNIKVISNYECIGLTPDNKIDIHNQETTFRPCGSGDLIKSAKFSGVWEEFVGRGGKYIVVCSGDNILCSSQPLALGHHISSNYPVTHLVVKSSERDSQGLLCEHEGINQIVERTRIQGVSTTDFQYSSAETVIFNTDLDLDFDWKWHRVKRSVNGRLVVSFERSLYELTSQFKTQFIEMARHYSYRNVRGITSP